MNEHHGESSFFQHRQARQKLEELLAAQTESRGISRLYGHFAIKRAENAVRDTGQHLSLSVVPEAILAEAASSTPQLDQLPVDAIGFGQIGDDEYFGS